MTKPMTGGTTDWTALAKEGRHAATCPGVLRFVERGTGVAHGEGQISRGGPSDRRPGLVALSSLAIGISVLVWGVLGSRRPGLETALKTRLFLGSGVPFSPI